MDVHDQCLNELVRVTSGLGLPIPPEEIRWRRTPWNERYGLDGKLSDVTYYMGITFYPQTETESAGTNLREDIGYPCGCLILRPADHSGKDNRAVVLDCRAKIRRRFIHQRLENVILSGGTFLTTKVAHLQINLPREAHRYEASSLLITPWIREPRG